MIPTPFRYRDLIGPPENYFIHNGYSARPDNELYDDTAATDEFQREVYEYARQVFDNESMQGVCDVGCGSGYKLMQFFGDKWTLGLDLPPIVDFLRGKYPDRGWDTADLARHSQLGPGHPNGLVICADVIEHLPDPEVLMSFLQRASPKRIIFSTPERDELNHGTSDGQPHNVHHVREWNWAEFHAYIGSRFEIIEHFVCAGTQIVDCRIK